MKKDLQVQLTRDAISLICNVAYKNESVWYGETERPLRMSLFVPKHKERCTKPKPLLVWLCGGALHVMDHNVWMPQLLSFAERGFIVASVEYRTVNESPLPAPLIDVKAAIRYLRAHADRYCIDPGNVFIMGESAGGMLASLVGVTQGKKEFEQGDCLEQSSGVNAVVDIYGIADLRAAYESSALDRMRSVAALEKVGSTEAEALNNLDRFSAIRYVNKDTVPFLILHGTADTTVELSQSESLYDKLAECGVPCDYYRLQGCGHGVDEFYQPEIMELAADFMSRYIKG